MNFEKKNLPRKSPCSASCIARDQERPRNKINRIVKKISYIEEISEFGRIGEPLEEFQIESARVREQVGFR